MRIQSSWARSNLGWLLAVAAWGCSGTPDNVCTVGSVGGGSATDVCTGGTTSVGGNAGTGGSISTGGINATGGSLSTGGSAATGGTNATGGQTSTGGNTSTGGALPTGGSPATGGTPATGGAAPTGGSPATGGTPATGGDVSTGGTPATGGDVSTGGTPATGGVPATGGAATGGDVPTGGTPPTGGSPATGGAATGGDVPTGGTPATGGAATGGDVATGGAATGGDVSTGGTPATGGDTSTGGASSISPDDAFAAAPKFPAVGATNVPVDAWINLTFDSPPVIGNWGHIRIKRASDDVQVDVINLADSTSTVKIGSTFTSGTTAFQACTVTTCNLQDFGFNTTVNYLGYDGNAYPRASWRVRLVKYNPVRRVGNQLRIYPHDGVLAYNTQYYVTIENDIDVSHPANSAVTGTLGGTAFAGVTSKTAWSFTTKTAAPAAPTAANPWKVNANGVSGDFMTVQGAINAVPPGSSSTYNVWIANGVYEELLGNYNKNNLVINGESRDGTIIQYENYDGFLPGTGGLVKASNTTTNYTTPLGDVVVVPIGTDLSIPTPLTNPTLFEGGRSLYELAGNGNEMNNLTVRNTHVKVTGTTNNAEALYYNVTTSAATTFISRNSNWISSQNTVQLKGYSWFYNSLIAGDVDIILGAPNVALFENCEIRTRVDPLNANSGGDVVQSKAPAGTGGFIFLNSTFTAETGVPAGSGYFAKHGSGTTENCVFTNCTVGPHINAAGVSGTSAVATPTDVLGLRQFGLKNPDTTPWSTSGLVTFYALTDTENTNLFIDRAKIYSGPTVSDGASTPKSYTSILWSLTP